MLQCLRIVGALALCLALFATSATAADAQPAADAWKPVDELVSQQKFQEALTLSQTLLTKAQAAKDTDEWTRALIRIAQLQNGLSSTETAVAGLRAAEWPLSLKSKALLSLYYAHTLMGYVSQYGYEIDQREVVETKQASVDLKALTRAQLWTEAARAYQDVWAEREALGAIKIDAWREFIQANDFPAGVRDTVRDGVSYFAAELLSDTANWRPEDSNNLFQLDFSALVASPAQASSSRLDDNTQHPLVRALAVLSDLEAWHAARGEKDGALAARLERLSLLRNNFPDDEQRTQIASYLDQILPRYRSVAWWSMGVAVRADLARDSGDLVRAHQLALDGSSAYPQSLGGQRCLRAAREIEAPEVQLRTMASDAPGKRSLLITHKNTPKIHFRAYRLDLIKRLESQSDYNALPTHRVWEQLKKEAPAFAWSVDLPATPDFHTHKTFVTAPMRELGLYFIVASTAEDFSAAANQLIASNMILSNLVITSRVERGTGLSVTVVDGESGKPVPGAEVRLYRFEYGKKNMPRERGLTDSRGEALFTLKKGHYGSYFIAALKDSDATLDPQQQYLSQQTPESEASAAFIYTDRSLYRPQQKIYWKALAYHGRRDKASFKTTAGQTMTVTLFDANRQKVAELSTKTNAFGSASGHFLIPAGRLLGSWTIRTSYGQGAASVQVEEYKRPTFEVQMKDPEAMLRMNREAEITGSARYYFGLPVTSGQVRWRVTREPIYPPWWGWFHWRGGESNTTAPQTVATGTAALAADGLFKIKFKPEAAESQDKSISYRYSVHAALTDEGGETRSADRTFRLGFVGVEATIATAQSFFISGNKNQTVTVQRATLDGSGKAGKGQWRLVSLKQPLNALPPAELPVYLPEKAGAFTTDGDRRRERWQASYDAQAEMARWEDGAEHAHGDLAHDASGGAELALPPLEPGVYRLHYETLDDFGATFKTFKDFVVSGTDSVPLSLPAYVAVQESTVRVGGTARFLIHSGRKNQTLFCDIFRNGRPTERRQLTPGSGEILAIPITETDRGGFALTVTAVMDHQLIQSSQTVFVPWDDKELSLSFSSFRDTMRPGGKETWRIAVKGPSAHAAQKGAVELLAYMYDKSLDAFTPHTPPQALSIYPDRRQVGAVRANVGPSYAFILEANGQIELPAYTPPHGDELLFYDSYAIGGPGGRKHGQRRGELSLAAPMALEAPAATVAKSYKLAARDAATAAESDAQKSAAPATAPVNPVAAKDPPLRTRFDETAFFRPQLLTNARGEATIEFTVPDSVTGWNVWVHAITKDMHAGSLHREARSVKELMVRPNLPRFFREGDAAGLKVQVNNAGASELKGTVALDIIDPATGATKTDLFQVKGTSRAFVVAPGKSATVAFELVAPKQIGVYAVRVSAISGAFSDGELRPVPVLPSRLHLAQSRFVALRDKDMRTLRFEDRAKTDDATRLDEAMVVTVDAQLFYSVLRALPYLVSYPYESTELVMNRFLTTGIVSKVFAEFPAVAAMAKELAQRKTPLAPFNEEDPNRKMTLEESPWLEEAQGGDAGDQQLIPILNPEVAKAQRALALAALKKAQYADGGFPWFPGGPPSEAMTLYLMHGFAKATEFGVDVPKDMVVRAWTWLGQQFRKNYAAVLTDKGTNFEFLTVLNYIASAYPDSSWTGEALKPEERQQILAHSFKHWKEHSPYLKAYLALTLKRMKRLPDAQLVLASIMDSAKTDKDLGTFWQPEDRSWLWYNDTIESQAFILRALGEVAPQDPKKDGLVTWLFLNKTLNHWKSTRATAEVIYSLAHYLKKEGSLGGREEVRVSAGGLQKTFKFEPQRYTGKAQLVVAPPTLKPQDMAQIRVEKATKGVAFVGASWHFSTDALPAQARGDFFTVERRYFLRDTSGKEVVLKPLREGAALAPGDQIEVQLALTSKHEAAYVHLRDPRAAGVEPENAVSRNRWDQGLSYYEEHRDSGSNFFFENLPAGQYTFKYRQRAAISGRFRVGPATAQSLYAPEFTAYSAGDQIIVQ